MFQKYSDMKREAEDYLLRAENIKPVILRPGLVWHQNQRQWSFPLKVATDLGYLINRDIVSKVAPGALQGILPQSSSIKLDNLSDFAIKGAMGQLSRTIYTNEEMNI